ncbi:hypothetical protein [Actinoplanes sp. N902-109]|uniref:hypothetical protein n=1 Tax=Actinoplanes sp. (strain N902-109) TaxID=649831 RepID=UPI0003294A22|nr:hypothetical protein [Actinoplanes sp. N902-109]AGL19808.1 hypothetical protein L083_6298 [Actinoplanes sp. N902-109]
MWTRNPTARAARAAEAALDELAARARRSRPLRRRSRPVRRRLAAFLVRRAREMAGLRESGKSAGLYRLQAVRHHLLAIGAELLADLTDIVFLTLDEVRALLDERPGNTDTLIVRRRALHLRESRRRYAPEALLSDGTDLETVLPPPTASSAPPTSPARQNDHIPPTDDRNRPPSPPGGTVVVDGSAGTVELC